MGTSSLHPPWSSSSCLFQGMFNLILSPGVESNSYISASSSQTPGDPARLGTRYEPSLTAWPAGKCHGRKQHFQKKKKEYHPFLPYHQEGGWLLTTRLSGTRWVNTL